jgi:hypothetical protein
MVLLIVCLPIHLNEAYHHTTCHTAKNVEIYISPFYCVSSGIRTSLFAQELGHRAADVHQPESSDRSDRLLDYGLPEVRRRPERGSHRVPDEPGALPQDPLPSRHLRARHQVIQLFFFSFCVGKSVLAGAWRMLPNLCVSKDG